ncbi:PA0069 family radical SAM protein [Rhodobacteraceae bacterium 63075]|nr:PA0069 family radical SAM protein [Rhodobacteraceae bacterium 63075]
MEAMSRIDRERRKGRGAASNRTGRFERLERVEAHDGWEIAEARAGFATELREERARSLISYNRSPDLPFDRSINPYRGCEHGCVYCFARPSHAYLGLSPGLDFETRLVARVNAAEVLERELAAKAYSPAPLAVGTNTDAYQPAERDRGIFRACLKVLSAASHPLAIVTKGALIERDLDLLAPMAARGLLRVGISVTTLDAELSRKMEPRVPRPARRLEVIRRLSAAGIPVRLMASPLVPGLTDHELEALLEAGKDAGASSASWIMLRLPREVSPLWQEWLETEYPARAGKVMRRLREMHGGKDYDARWHRRMRGEGPYAEAIAARFRLAAARLGLDAAQPALRCDLFERPLRKGDQLSLF